jgi:hypothetical protein
VGQEKNSYIFAFFFGTKTQDLSWTDVFFPVGGSDPAPNGWFSANFEGFRKIAMPFARCQECAGKHRVLPGENIRLKVGRLPDARHIAESGRSKTNSSRKSCKDRLPDRGVWRM